MTIALCLVRIFLLCVGWGTSMPRERAAFRPQGRSLGRKLLRNRVLS